MLRTPTRPRRYSRAVQAVLVAIGLAWAAACESPQHSEPASLDTAPAECVTPEPVSNPTADDSDRLRLVFYTDVQATQDWGVPEAMVKAADAINTVEPDLVIAGGDLIFGGFSSSDEEAEKKWAVYAKLRDALAAPNYAALGNHDLVGATSADPGDSETPRRSFVEQQGLERTYYAFDVEGYHFIVLDTVRIVGGNLGYEGGIDEGQRQWLVDHLAELGPAKPLVLVSHMPLLSAYPVATNGWLEVPGSNRVIQSPKEILDIFEGHNLELVLQGHLHAFERIDWKGTTFVTGGAISGDWWRGPHLGTAEGFCVIELGGDQVDVRYETYGWKTRRH